MVLPPPNPVSSRWRLARAVSFGMLCALSAVLCGLGSMRGPNVAIVLTSTAGPYQQAADAAEDTLRRRGEVPVMLELSGDAGAVNQELGRRGIDKVIAVGTEAAVMLSRDASEEREVFYCMVGGSSAEPLLEDMRAVGVTTDVAPEEQIGLIAQVLPGARHIGMLYRADDAGSVFYRDALAAALPDGWRLTEIDVGAHASLSEAISELVGQRPDIVWTAPDRGVVNSAFVKVLLTETLKHSIPVYGFSTQFVRGGALFGLAVSPSDQGEQAAGAVLDDAPDTERGAMHIRPRTTLVVNMIVAERIGKVIPAVVLEKADDVYED